MKRCTALLLIAVVSFAIVGCSRTAVVALDEAHMNAAAFLQNTVTLRVGQPLKFIDDGNGATHILVIGTNGAYVAQDGAPKDLTGAGITVNAGETKSVVFATAGTYSVTCTIHPAMLVTVTVT